MRFQEGEQQSQIPTESEFNRRFRSEQNYSSKYRISSSKKRLLLCTGNEKIFPVNSSNLKDKKKI